MVQRYKKLIDHLGDLPKYDQRLYYQGLGCQYFFSVQPNSIV